MLKAELKELLSSYYSENVSHNDRVLHDFIKDALDAFERMEEKTFPPEPQYVIADKDENGAYSVRVGPTTSVSSLLETKHGNYDDKHKRSYIVKISPDGVSKEIYFWRFIGAGYTGWKKMEEIQGGM